MSKLLVALLSLAGATVGFAVGRHFAPPESDRHVYEISCSGIVSYVERHGNILLVSDHWASCVMIDPEIKGERVYIPPTQHLCDRDEFFFLDTLVKIRTAYATRAETKIYREDGTGAEPVVTEDKFCNDWIIDSLSRVYLDTTTLKSDGSDGRRFVYRRELTLLCHYP